jgi:RNA polymerase sigma factor (sigma-70 family)
MRATEDQLKAWMIRGLDGDAKAHAALLGALAPLLSAFFRRRMHDGQDDIEDLVQDTLIAIHTRRDSYDRDRVFSAWMYSVARYKMIDHFRAARRHVPFEGLEDILVAEGFESASNARMDVDVLLAELPDKQARTIRDTKIAGFSVTEAAARSEISESDVKVSIHRGLKSLAARMLGDRR